MLARKLAETELRPTPLVLLELAYTKWLAGQRLDLGRLAEELSISRATVFRWAGSREQLYGEVVWKEIQKTLDIARKSTENPIGTELISRTAHVLMSELLSSPAMQTFIHRDPAFAMRILLSNESPVAQRMIAEVEGALSR